MRTPRLALRANNNWRSVRANGQLVEIPVDWTVCGFYDIGTFANGSAFTPGEWRKSGRPIIRIQNLTNPVSADMNFYEGSPGAKVSLVDGDYCYAWSGTIGVYQYRGPEAVLNQHIFKVGALPGKCNLDFLAKKLQAETPAIRGLGRGLVMSHVTVADLKQHQIVVPPVEEQDLIASVLAQQELALHGSRQLLTALETRLRYFSQELLSGRLRVKKIDGNLELYRNDDWVDTELNLKPVQIPREWAASKLGAVLALSGEGGTPPTADSSYYDGGGVNWAVIDDIRPRICCTKKQINEKGLRQIGGVIWQPGDVLVSTGATIGAVGRVEVPLATKQGISGLRPLRNRLASEFLYHMLAANESLLKRSSNGSTFLSLPQGQLRSLEFAVPPWAEQECVASVLNALEQELALHRELIAAEQKRFTWLLDNLMSGRYLVEEVEGNAAPAFPAETTA